MVLALAGFVLFIFLLLALDLGAFHRRPHVITFKESMIWSAVWVGTSIAFAVVVYDGYERHRLGLGTAVDAVDGRLNDGISAVGKYLTAYLLEKALSVDNLFVMAVIFRFLAVPVEQQHKVLFWGILGALIARGVLIGVGVELIRHYHWVLYLFGAFLAFTGARLLAFPERPPDPSRDPVLRLVRRVLPFTSRYQGGRFLTIENGRRVLTPLALALILVETSDIVFATDSIPAVFSVTDDPLLIYTSNILAVLGLRSLYFALAGLLERFRHMKVSLAMILILAGGKMIAGRWFKQAAGEYASYYLLAVVALVLAAGIVASVVSRRRSPRIAHELPHP